LIETTRILDCMQRVENNEKLILFTDGRFGYTVDDDLIGKLDMTHDRVYITYVNPPDNNGFIYPMIDRVFALRNNILAPIISPTGLEKISVTPYIDRDGKVKAIISLSPETAKLYMNLSFDDWDYELSHSNGGDVYKCTINFVYPGTVSPQTITVFVDNFLAENNEEIALSKAVSAIGIGSDIYRENVVLDDSDALIQKGKNNFLFCKSEYEIDDTRSTQNGKIVEVTVKNKATNKIVADIIY